MVFDVLETRTEVGVAHENQVQQVFLGGVEQGRVEWLATEDLVVHALRVCVSEGCDTIKQWIIKDYSYPVTRSHIRTPRDQISAWKPCPIPLITSGAI